MRGLLRTLGAAGIIALAACGGRVVVDGFDSSGGQGGAPNGSTGTLSAVSSTAFATVTAVSVSSGAITSTGSFISTGSFPSTGSFASSAATGGSNCVTCAEMITGPDFPSPSQLCSKSAALFQELAVCVCNDICPKVCGDTACVGLPQSPECITCILDTSAGCGFEFKNCANDI